MLDTIMQFDILTSSKRSKARAGIIQTAHGPIETPIFMPVGTAGTVKGVLQRDLNEAVNAQIILGNTYHLYLRPTTQILESAGGLHKFIGWDKPILTDSGGYQVYSLAHRRKIKEEGVTFNSHIDGSKHFLSPETAIDVQRSIGGDIIMAFDECTPYPCEYHYAKKSMDLTHRWLKRCIERFDSTEGKYGYNQTLSPIVQGSVYKDLRIESAKFIANQGRPMNAIGGLSVGEPAEMMYEMTDLVTDYLPLDKPRYLMGVGTPANILECIECGIDMFDCVLPSRNARHGLLYTMNGIINIKNQKWRTDFGMIDETLDNGVSNVYTKAYLRHLMQCQELLAFTIATIHNLSFFLHLVKTARIQILAGNYEEWKKAILPNVLTRL